LTEDIHYTILYPTGYINITQYNKSDIYKADYSFYHCGIKSAWLSLYNSTHDQIVGEAITDSLGNFNISIWAGTFELRCEALDYEKNVSSLLITTNYTSDIILNKTFKVWGWVFDSDGYPAVDVKAYLYCIDDIPQSKKLIEANVAGSYYYFNAFPGNFTLIRDAANLEASITTSIQLSGSMSLGEIYLQESDEEKITTNILYNAWDNITITINKTLNAESCIEGLDVSDMRSARLQIDVAFGNGNGALNQPEVTAFENWIKDNGPRYVVTDEFLTADNMPYISDNNLSNYIVNVALNVTDTEAGKIWINTTAYYNTTDIALDKSLYNLTLSAEHDSSNNLYKNRTYTIELPHGYEMTENTIINGNVDVNGYTNLAIDPKIGSGVATVKMTIERSESGVAKAKIIDGVFYELNDTYENYTAIVCISNNITFSAAESTDLVGDINEANFTWDFNDAASPENGYGMECVHNFTVKGEYIVNLTVTETGGNKTYRDITVKIDGIDPTAEIGSNMDIVNDVLYVDENVEITFNGTNSLDYVYGTEEGVIEWWYWDWESDGLTDMEVHMDEDNDVTHTYTEPGSYNLTLNVTDVVGHRSVNKTITVYVNDTTPPTPKFVMLDPEDWEEIQSGEESITYYFNASETTDNYDDPVNLTYEWDL
jgi:PKD repeat protein